MRTVWLMAIGLATVTGCGGERREVRSARVEVRGASEAAHAPAARTDPSTDEPPTGAAEPPAAELPVRSIARRDLGPLPPELDALRWPEPPRIDRELEATDATALQRAIDTGRTRVRVTGRIAGTLVVHASDVEIVIGEGARIEQVVIDRGVHRVRVADGAIGGVELLPPAMFTDDHRPRYDEDLFVEDVTLDGLRVDASDSAFVIRGRRVAVLGCDVRAERYSLWAGDTGPLDGEDLIVAGNTFRSAGPESTLRMHDVRRSVVVDDVLENGRKHNYRVHGRSDLAFAARNTLIRTGMMLGTEPGDAVGTIFFVDNVLHHEAPSLLDIDPSGIRRLVYRGNVAYTDVWDSCYPYPSVREGWTVEDNLREAFRPWPGPEAAPR